MYALTVVFTTVEYTSYFNL